ncbi:N-6 DNA methylase [Amycolatopsis lexingtonensis]|uniref:type I restriction-modification system subunit M/S n=1 Tax=Amycolatopsis lexingtonensis TaxID=218822 RepID=UPI003F715C44
MTKILTSDVADRLWRAYAPYQRGRNTVGDLTSMFALLVLAQFVESMRESEHDFVKQWDRAIAESAIADVSPVMDLRSAWVNASRHPDFPVPDVRDFEFIGRYEQPEDMPWAAAFLTALVQCPTPADAGLPDVADLLLERHSQESASASGEFFVPRAVANLLVDLTSPQPGDRVLDPACGSGSLLATAVTRIADRGHLDGASLEAYATDPGNFNLAMMNLAVHGVDRPIVGASDPVSLLYSAGDRLFDAVLSNPPFNQRIKYSGKATWPFELPPPESNANFAWLLLAWSRLSPKGLASIIMPQGAAWANGREAQIRRKMVESGALLGVIALPPNLFTHTAVPVHVWLLARDKSQHLPPAEADAVLFIDASRLGTRAARRPRVLAVEEVTRVSSRLREWRQSPRTLSGEPGFSRSVTHEDILKNDGNLDPRLYVNVEQERPEAAPDLGPALDELGRHADATMNSSADLQESLDRYERLTRNESAPPRVPLIEIVEAAMSSPSNLLAGPSGSHIRADNYVDAPGVPVVMPKDLAGNKISAADIRYISERHAAELDRFRLRGGDVVLARRGELGRCAVVRPEEEGWVCGTGCFILRPPAELDAGYFAAYLESAEAREWLENRSTGSTAMKTISLAALGKLPVPLPDLGTQRALAATMVQLDHHERLLREQLTVTQKIRREALNRRPL